MNFSDLNYMRKAADAVYLVADAVAADDLSRILSEAADEIAHLRATITEIVATIETEDGECAHASNQDGGDGPIFHERFWNELVSVAVHYYEGMS